MVHGRLSLFEREEELEALGSALDGIRGGDGGLIVVEGPAGIGKTRLLESAIDGANERSMLALTARASELERAFPYGIVRQLFEFHVARAAEKERALLLRGPARPAEPILGNHGTNVQKPDGDSYVAGLHALYWLTTNLCESAPLLLCVDDLHWADAPSLRFLGFLLHRLEDLPLLVLLSTRTGDTGADPDLLVPLVSEPRAQRLCPAPLTRAAAVELARQALPAGAEDGFCRACHRASGGNPFLLSELLTELRSVDIAPVATNASRVAELGAGSISRAVVLRLSRLSSAATALARAVAILGDGAELRDCARMAGLTLAASGEAADALTAADILAPGRPISFAHPVLRAAITEDLTATAWTDGHERAARMLADAGAAPERVATHLLAVEPADDPWVLRTLMEAAQVSAGRGAPDAVVLYLERAMREPPLSSTRPTILRDLGLAGLSLGKPEASAHLREALDLLEDPVDLVRVARALAAGSMLMAQAAEAVDALEGTIARIPPSERDLVLELEADLAAHAELNPQARMSTERRLERYGSLEGSTPAERLANAALAFQRARRAGSAAEAGALAELGLAGGRLLTDDGAVLSGPSYNLLIMLISVDRLELAQSCLDQILSAGRTRGSPLAIGTALMWRSTLAYRRGAIAEAEAEAQASLNLSELVGWHPGLPFVLAFWVDALIERNELDRAEEALRRREIPATIPPLTPLQPVLLARARLRLARGETRAGLDDLLEFGRREESGGLCNPRSCDFRAEAAIALASLGEHDRARRLADDDLKRARRWGAPRGIGTALRAAGLVDESDAGLELLRESVVALEDSPARLDLARALTDLGARLRRANRRSDAREPLRRALELAHGCQSALLAERAHQELLATGARPRRIVQSGPGSLTPSERRISAIAASGLSNTEIAGSLFLSSKTVEMHLSNAYRKLGIHSRTELPFALAPEDGEIDLVPTA